MSQSKRRLLELNARLAQNLTDKDVEATADETTTTLVDKVVEIPSPKEEQEKTVDITENGTYDALPDEGKVLSKVTVNVNVADSDDNSTLIQLIERNIDVFINKDVMSIGKNAFTSSANLTYVNCPNVEVIDVNAFNLCQYLNTAVFNNVKEIKALAFNNCIRLSTIEIENVEIIQAQAFLSTPAVKKMFLPKIQHIYATAFIGISSVATLVIKTRPILDSPTVFPANSNIVVYVNKADLEWYSTATNWSSLYEEGRVLAIEDNIEYLQGLGYVFEEVAE